MIYCYDIPWKHVIEFLLNHPEAERIGYLDHRYEEDHHWTFLGQGKYGVRFSSNKDIKYEES